MLFFCQPLLIYLNLYLLCSKGGMLCHAKGFIKSSFLGGPPICSHTAHRAIHLYAIIPKPLPCRPCHAATRPGIRILPHYDDESEGEAESYDEVMSELTDPWMHKPGAGMFFAMRRS